MDSAMLLIGDAEVDPFPFGKHHLVGDTVLHQVYDLDGPALRLLGNAVVACHREQLVHKRRCASTPHSEVRKARPRVSGDLPL